MEWLLILSQGGGCDYTIGCGYDHWTVEGDTEEEARQEARDMLDREGYLDTSPHATVLSSVEMYPLAGKASYLPIAGWREEEKKRLEEARKVEVEKQRRRQYEQLKREFEGG